MTTEERIPSGVELTALDEAFERDPYPVLDRLRSAEPVHHDTTFRRYVLTSHDDIDTVLRDRAMQVDPRKAADGTYMKMFSYGEEGGQPSMLFLDAPDHTRLRSLVTKAFTPRAVEQLTPRIQQIVNGLLDAVADREGFDLIEAFAAPLPTIVIAEMLGIDASRQAEFKRWSDDTVQAFDPLISEEGKERVRAANDSLREMFRAAIAERRSNLGDDLISGLIAAKEANDQLSDDEIVTMCDLLLAAGNVTTTDLIGNGVLALLQHPKEMQKLRDAPSLMKNAIEEMLRYDSPVVQTARIPAEEVTVGGCPIAHGQSIVTSLAAANRDPGAYEEPDTFDITRKDVHHHSFGGGAHYCLGAPLARLEAQVAISTLLKRFPSLRLADEELRWRKLPSFRGLLRLPVVIS